MFDEDWTEQGASAWTLRHPASLASLLIGLIGSTADVVFITLDPSTKLHDAHLRNHLSSFYMLQHRAFPERHI